MQSIKQMTDEFNHKYPTLASKIVISLGLLVLVCFFGWILLMVASVMASTIFAPAFASLITMGLLFLLYAMFFVLFYGTVILMTRLKRNMRASLGYIFLGFHSSKRITSCVWIFSALFFIVVMISAVPVILSVDITQQDALVNLMKDTAKLKVISKFVTAVFFFSFIIIFFRFAFVWNIIYDTEDIRGIKAFVKSWKMFNGHVLQFFAFEAMLCWRFILMIVIIDITKILIAHVNSNGLDSFFGYLYGFMGFSAVLLMFTKVALSVPFFYDKLRELEAVPPEENTDADIK